METRNRKYSNFNVVCMAVVILLGLCSAYFVAANQPPVADANPDYQTVYAGEEVWFTANGSYDLDGCIVSYFWDFGVGMYLSGMTISYVFNALGNFTVTLIVTDDAGDTATDTVYVNVIEKIIQPDEPMVWIESLVTDKEEYNINEPINTIVTVKRGNDMLTYVWEGTLVLEVFDSAMALVYTEDCRIYLPYGGAIDIRYFKLVLSESGDYLMRASLYDLGNVLIDIEETCITVTGEPSGGDVTVWIESLTTDKQVYEINETVNTTVIVRRGNDMLTYVWEGTLTLEVFDDTMFLVYIEDQGVYLPCGGTTETHYYEFVLTEPCGYLVKATLYDMNDILVDTEEIRIMVTEDPSGRNVSVWIESLTTDKQVYNVNELVSTKVIVERGNDLLDYVWEGTLTLDVFDDNMDLVYTEDQRVCLSCGGMTETHYFEFVLSEPSGYLVRATLYDMFNTQTDTEEIWIKVFGEPPSGIAFVWIEFLTTDKHVYEVNETVNTTVIVRRGNDMLTFIWEGTLTLEVFNDAMVLVYTEDQEVYLLCGGATMTHCFEFFLPEPGGYLVRATLYDMNDIPVDTEEIRIMVTREPSGGNDFVWIESLTTDKQAYTINETVNATVLVRRGYDLLTYVWEGTLTLEVFNDAMVLIYTEDHEVYLPCGGMTETHYFEFILTDPGDYLLKATLYDMNDILVDIEELCITVSEEPSGGNGTVPTDGLGIDLSKGSDTGLFGGNGGWQTAFIEIGIIAFMALLAFTGHRGLVRFWNRKK